MALSLDDYAPFDAGAGADVTEDTWRAMMRRANVSGVVKNVTNELFVYGDATGMQVKIKEGEVVIEGYWGANNTEKTIGITNNASGFMRLDTIVARANWVDNVVEFDVLTGVPNAPTGPMPTRDSSRWEVPLALVAVPTGSVTITGTNVFDIRQWGGPPVVTVTDDYLLFGDKLSTCRRYDCVGETAVTNGNVYVVRMQSLGEQVCTKLRMCPNVLPVGGTVTARIFRGYRYDNITQFIDPTTSTFLYGGTAGTVHETAITPTLFRAGEAIAIAIASSGTSTAASMAQNAVTGAVNMSGFINPGQVYSSAFKTGSMPVGFNLSDGSWTKRDRLFWAALA